MTVDSTDRYRCTAWKLATQFWGIAIDMASLRCQIAATVASLFRSTRYQYETSVLDGDTLTPLAHQLFRSRAGRPSLRKNRVHHARRDLQRDCGARLSCLQAANQFLARRVALEQAIGMPLPQ